MQNKYIKQTNSTAKIQSNMKARQINKYPQLYDFLAKTRFVLNK